MGRQSLAITGTHARAVAISVAVVALLAMLGPARAEAATGSISGTVLDGNGQAIPGVCVGAAGIGNNNAGSDITGPNGEYTIAGLPTGNFGVSFVACGNDDYITEHYDDKASFNNATPVSVVDGQPTTGINATLADGGSISGHVDSGSTPLVGVCVDVIGPTTARAVTNGSGDYLVRNLAPGSYTVSFAGCTAGNFVSEFYDGVTDAAAATPLVVSEHARRSNIDADLALAGSISGTVTDSLGTSRPGVCVKAHQEGSAVVRSTETGSDGSYSIPGLPTGDYKVEFEDCSGVGVFGEFWNDRLDMVSADPVHVSAPAETPSVDGILAIDPGVQTATISGRVTNSSGSPINGICVTAHPETESVIPGFDQTNATGDYVITGLEADDYAIEFSSCTPPFPYITEYWNDKLDIDDANLFFVGAGETAANKNAVLANDPNVDITPPDPPSITGSSPPSPNKVNDPKVVGTAEAGSTVRVYPSNDCSGTEVTGSAAQFASPGIQAAAVPDNSETTYTATATDTSGNTSACSTSFTYTEDSDPPPAPSLAATSPASPSNDGNPKVTGTAESGSTVQIYRSADCSGDEAATGAEALLGTTGITVDIPDEGTTQLTATATDAAGNTSPCSSPLDYLKDSTPPPAPDLTSTDPNSPADNDTPLVRGTAEDGATIDLYTTSGCSGSPVETGTEDELSGAGIQATVADDSTTDFRATATDALGNTSSCSGPLTYVEDSTPPDAPELTSTDPASPANANNPEVRGDAEPGSSVDVYATSDCSGPVVTTGTAGELADPGLTVSVADNSTASFTARATDAAGHTSSCSAELTYVHDADPPAAPNLTGVSPASPADDNSPRVIGSADSGTTIRIYSTADCTGDPIGVGTASELAGAGVAASVPDDATVDLRARAVDAAGNESACSNAVQYEEDSTPPPAPTLNSTDPASPASDTEPELKGSAAAGTTIDVFAGNCAGTPLATGTVADFEAAGITVPVSADTTTALRATATDAAGNESACSAALDYVEDSTDPIPAFASGPSGTTKDGSGAFALRANENDVAFRCSLDGEPFSSCPANPSFGPLEPGTYTLEVTATDDAGNESDPEGRTWTVDSGADEDEMSGSAAAGGVVTSDPAGAGPGAGRPMTVAVTVPAGGPVTIVGVPPTPLSPPSGFTLLGGQLDISAPTATAAQPLRLDFRIDSSQIPAGTDRSLIAPLRDGSPAANCLGSNQALPSPCVTLRQTLGDGDLRLVVLTAQASAWRFAVAPAPPPPPPPSPPPPGDDPPSDPPPADSGDGGGSGSGNPPPPAQCVVPKLKGMSTSAAKTALMAAKCALGKITKKKVKKGKSGKVLSQSPAAGQALAAGATVDVTVSKVKKKKKKK